MIFRGDVVSPADAHVALGLFDCVSQFFGIGSGFFIALATMLIASQAYPNAVFMGILC